MHVNKLLPCLRDMSLVLPSWIKAVSQLLSYFDLEVVGDALTDFTFLNHSRIPRAEFVMHPTCHTPLIVGRNFALHWSVVQRDILRAIQSG